MNNKESKDHSYSSSSTSVNQKLSEAPENSNRRGFIWRAGTVGIGALSLGTLNSRAQSTSEKALKTDEEIAANCVLSPSQTEGPYYLNLNRVRRDITEGRDGMPLTLKLKVMDAIECVALPSAVVDIWHCDAQGEYSGYDSSRPLRSGHMEPDSEQVFLRGVQMSDSSGEVTFDTIYPGCYTSRTTHIHVKVYINEREMVTTQIYFPDVITNEVYRDRRYRSDRSTNNSNDYIFRRARAEELAMLEISRDGDRGFLGQLNIGVRRA